MKALITIITALICLTGKAQSQETDTVYVNPEAGSYHHKSCHWLESDSVAATQTQAQEKGYTACKICYTTVDSSTPKAGSNSNPKTSNSSSSQSTDGKTSSPRTYSTRCRATTQKGTRCKRMVRNGSYCWQHQ